MPIEAQNVVAGYYKDVNILNGVSLVASDSHITGIIGPNGAGKSTLLKTIVGFLKPRDGRILFSGEDISQRDPHEIIAKGISYVPQRRSVFPLFSVEDNLRLACWKFRKDPALAEASIGSVYEQFPLLKKRRLDRAGNMSGGQQRLLELARAFVQRPRFIVVDEPSAGLDPKSTNEVYQELMNLIEAGIPILLVDQNIKKAVDVSDYIFVLSLGKNSIQGPKDDIEQQLHKIIKDWLLT